MRKTTEEIVELVLTKSCYYRALIGINPSKEDCSSKYKNGCNDCPYYLPDPHEPKNINEKDEY